MDDHYGALAHHYSQGGNSEKAIEYLGLAGQQAVRRSANAEALNHFTQALELLQRLPDSPERDQQELALQVALGPVLMATGGYVTPEVEHAYSRARELCETVGDTPALFPTLWGLWAFYVIRADHDTAHELGEQLLRLAQDRQDLELLLEAHYAMGTVLFFMGEFAASRRHLEQVLALYDVRQHHQLAYRYGLIDPGALAFSVVADSLWLLGYAEQALRQSRQAVSLANELSHPISSIQVLNIVAALHLFRREGPAAQDRAEVTTPLLTELGSPILLGWSTALHGGAVVAQGQTETGMNQIRQGLTVWQAAGVGAWQSLLLALLAEAYGKADRVEEGLATVAEALAFVARTKERFYEAELHRLQGELILQKFKARPEQSRRVQDSKPVLSEVEGFNGEEEAEACFHKAIEIAQKQEAKSWELRAATSLARLWQQQGKMAEARELLSPVYNWFTEGFDTADLKDAKALLAELDETAKDNES